MFFHKLAKIRLVVEEAVWFSSLCLGNVLSHAPDRKTKDLTKLLVFVPMFRECSFTITALMSTWNTCRLFVFVPMFRECSFTQK